MANITVQALHNLHAALGARGIDADAFLARHGVALHERGPLFASSRSEGPRRLAHHRILDIKVAAARALEDPDFGLELVQRVALSDYDGLDHLAASAPTLDHGLSTFVRAFPLWERGNALTLERADGCDRVRYRHRRPHPDPLADRIDGQHTVGLFSRFVEASIDPGPRAVVLGFPYPEPGPAALERHRETWPWAELRFASDDWQVQLPHHLMRAPRPRADPSLFHVLETAVETMLRTARDDDELLVRMRAELGSMLHERPTASALARRLGMSTRTMQRRLEALGTAFADVLGEVRGIQARERLAQGDPPEAIAEGLGYSSRAAFDRAFRGWAGETPGQFRRRARVQR